MLLLVMLVCFTPLLSTVHSANVLVIANLKGSHLYVSTDVAEKLVQFGHNVTVVTMFDDDRIRDAKDRPFHFIAAVDDNEVVSNFMKRLDAIIERFIHRPSPDMMADLVVTRAKDEVVQPWMVEYGRFALKYFQGEEFSKLLEAGEFKLVVLEDTISTLAMAPLVERQIPVMGLVCHSGARDENDRYGLPGLLNSVPSRLNADVSDSQTIADRWKVLVRLARFYGGVYSIVQSLSPYVLTENYRKNPKQYFKVIYDVVFVNDHPAFSFPYLSPPNTFYLGPFNLENRDLNPLPKDYQEFLENCPHKHTIFFSFGSYLQNITVFSGTPTILTTLRQMNVCVIIKSEVDLRLHFDLPTDRFLQRSWIPQKDLLGSGRLDFFISHCGNTGRLEAVYYNVPLLCVPLFADQYLNGRLVERNQFGLLLTWESLTKESLVNTVDKLLTERETYVFNMKRAVEIARNDPGSGVEMLKFYTDLLIRNRNTDYLVNRVILNLSVVQKYNLDIAAMALIVFVGAISGIIFCMVRSFKFCCRRVFSKIKTD